MTTTKNTQKLLTKYIYVLIYDRDANTIYQESVGCPHLDNYPKGQRIIILKNVPKTQNARQKLLKDIELRANTNYYKVDFKLHEDYYSLYNRYARQWEAIVALVHGTKNIEPDFEVLDIDYNYGDVIA